MLDSICGLHGCQGVTACTFLVAVGRITSTNHVNHVKNAASPLIQPLSVHILFYPGGALSMSTSCICFLAKIIKGGIKDPVALQQQCAVVRVPLSELDMISTCFFPWIDKLLGGLLVVVRIPVSSML